MMGAEAQVLMGGGLATALCCLINGKSETAAGRIRGCFT